MSQGSWVCVGGREGWDPGLCLVGLNAVLLSIINSLVTVKQSKWIT